MNPKICFQESPQGMKGRPIEPQIIRVKASGSSKKVPNTPPVKATKPLERHQNIPTFSGKASRFFKEASKPF